MKKWIIGAIVVAAIAVVAWATFGQGRIRAVSSEPVPTLPPVKAENVVQADGVVVPVRSAVLSLPIGGVVQKVLVGEGSAVSAGQALVQLDAARQRANLAQAEAGVLRAQAGLDQLLAGARPQEVEGARAAVEAAEARLAKLRAGATAEESAAAQAAVDVARAGAQTAEGALAGAQANLARLQAGATPEEIAIAERQVEQAKNALWGAQAQRDAACGRVGHGGSRADCDTGNAAVQRGEEEVRIAELHLQQLRSGPREEEIAAARAQVTQAQGQLDTARAQIAQAEARLAQLRAGTSPEDIAAAEAEVHRARAQHDLVEAGARPETIAAAGAEVAAAIAVLEQAKVALDETILHAPFDGTVAQITIKVGEQVAAGSPVVRLADLTVWQIETSDLTELSVVNISVGNQATVTFDAISDLTLSGTVTRIVPIGENKHGDVIYTVVIVLDEQDPRLRWNMTASVSIEPNE